MNKIAIFGGGTIIGAAIIVVLPESSGILINAQNKLDQLDGKTSDELVTKQVAKTIGLAIIFGFSLMMLIDETFKIIKDRQILSQIEIQKKQEQGSHLGEANTSNMNYSMLPAMTPYTAKSRREEK